MASQEEDNKRECKSNVNIEQERNFITVYKRYESILNSKTEPLATKIQALIQVWNCIGQCNLTDSDSRFIVHIIDWAKLHTLNVVLTGEWKKYKDDYETKLITELESTQKELRKVNKSFATRCQKLATVIKNPWNHPILDNLLKTPDAPVGRKEIEFFSMETAYLVSVRLKKLCESQCEDLALNLVSAYMKCYNLSESENLSLNATDTQIWFIFDIYVMLLHKFKELNMLLSLLKGITLEEGLSLIKRFYKKRVKISKVWKNSSRVAHLASQIFILSSVTKPIEESGTVLKQLLDVWLEYNNEENIYDDLCRDIRRMIDNVVTASHIYVFADSVHRNIGLKLKAMIIELYVRALTTDMNDLEIKKNENNDEKVKAITERLAAGFCSLADVLEDNVKVSRECVLTAFSLDPTIGRLKHIEDLARKSGFQVLDTGQDWKCKLHPPALPTDDLVWICKTCNDWMCKPQLNVPLNTNLALHEALSAEHLGLSPQLCDDLVVVLSCPRYQVLSWLVDWYDLHRLCIMYLNDPQSTKNLVTELKFVDIDYAMFDGIKREPVDELAGIEKGYEQYLDQNYSDEQLSTSSDDGLPRDCRLSLGNSDGGETVNSVPLLQPVKSDPNTLKSLRMFRPNLKRSRNNQLDSNVPEKIFRPDQSNNLLRQTIITPSTSGAVDYSSTAARSIPMSNSHSDRAYSPAITNIPSTSFQYSFLAFSAEYNTQKGLDTKITEVPDAQLLPYDLSTSRTMDPKNGKSATLPLSGVQVAKEKEQISSKPSPQHATTKPTVKDKKQKQSHQNKNQKQSSHQKQNKKQISSNKKQQTVNVTKDVRVQLPRLDARFINSLQKNVVPSVKKQLESTIILPQTVTKIQNQVSLNSSSSGDHRLNQSPNSRKKPKLIATIVARQDPTGTLTLVKKEKNNEIASSNAVKETVGLNFTKVGSVQMIKEKIASIARSHIESRCQPNSSSDIKVCTKNFRSRSNSREKHIQSETNQTRTKYQAVGTLNRKLHSAMPAKIKDTQSSSGISTIDSSVFHTVSVSNTESQSTLSSSATFLSQNQETNGLKSCTHSSTSFKSNSRSITINSDQITIKTSSKVKEINVPIPKCDTKNEILLPPKSKGDSSVIRSSEKDGHMNEAALLNFKQSKGFSEKQPPSNAKKDLGLATKSYDHTKNDIEGKKYCNDNKTLNYNICTQKFDVSCEDIVNRKISDNYEIVLKNNTVSGKSNKNKDDVNHFRKIGREHVTSNLHVVNSDSETHVINGARSSSQLNIDEFKLESEPQNTQDSGKKKNITLEKNMCKEDKNFLSSEPVLVVKLTKLSECILEKFLEVTDDKPIEIKPVLHNKDSCLDTGFLAALDNNSLNNKSTGILNIEKPVTAVSSGSISTLNNVIASSTCLPLSSRRTKSISLNSKSIAPSDTSTKEKFDPVLTRPKNSVRKTYFNKTHGNKFLEKSSSVNGLIKCEQVEITGNISNSSELSPQASATIETAISKSVELNPAKPQKLGKAISVNDHKRSVSASTSSTAVAVNIPMQSNDRVYRPPSHVETLICEIRKKEVDDYHAYLQKFKRTARSSTVTTSNSTDTSEQIEVPLRGSATGSEIPADDLNIPGFSTQGLTSRPARSCNYSLFRRWLNRKRNSLISEQALNKSRSALKFQDTFRVISRSEDQSVLSDECFHESVGRAHYNPNFRKYAPKHSRLKIEESHETNKTVQKKTKATQTCIGYEFNQRRVYRKLKTSYKRRLKHNFPSNSMKTCEIKNSMFEPKTGEGSNCESVTRTSTVDANKLLPEYNYRKRKLSTECISDCKKYIGSYKTYNKICLDCVSPKTGKKRLVRKKSENDTNSRAPKRVQKYQLSPLQDINPRIPTADITVKKQDKKMDDDKSESPIEPPSERYGHINLNSKSVLSSVPGLKALDMILPGNVDHIVNVVQISGGRATSTVTSQNSQTSTQVSPHIQRIGQPRVDKPEQLNNADGNATITSSSITNSTTSKPTTSESSALINILSQQIVRPGQSNCVRTRPSPLINILSQQIIKPANNNQNIQKHPANSVQSSETLVNNFPKTITTSEQSGSPTVNAAKNSSTVKTVVTTASSGQGSTILQLICKSTLPKFQQAFGKSVYQNSTENTEATTTSAETPTTSVETSKKPQLKNSSVNIQPIQGGVIYTTQMPVGQTINLLPPGRGQVFRIATSNSDQISLVKDTVIHSKMSALLAAALQGKQKSSDAPTDGDTSNEESNTRVAVTARPALLQNTRIVKPVLQIPSNVIRTSPQSNLSSTTLEQLREFDMVYKQIKERSSTGTPAESNASNDSSEAPQRISVTYVNQGQKYTQLSPVVVVSSSYCNLQPAASPALSVTSQGSSSPCVTPAPTPAMPKVSTKNSKGKTVKNTTTHTSKASPIPKPQQKPQEDEHTTQRIFDILAEYAEQLRNSPDLNNKPAPRRRSNPPTNPSQNSKRKKSSGSKKTGQCSSVVSDADLEDHRTVGSEDSSCGVAQLSVPEEEQQLQTTTESNDSNSSTRQQLILTEASNSQTHNLIIAEPTVGEALKMPNTAVLVPGNYIMPVSMVKGGQQIAVVSGGSKILATVPARSGPNMLLFQSFLNQNKKTGVPTVKYSTIQPISGISQQSISNVNAQSPVILPPNSHSLTAVTLGQPIALKKVDETDKVNTELLLTISQPRDNCNSTSENQPDSSSAASNVDNDLEEVNSDQTFQKSITNTPIATPVIAQTSCNKDDLCIKNENPGSQSGTLITLNLSENKNKDESVKSGERVQSVLVTACTSNGPMLSHTPPRYRKPENTGLNHESNKEEFIHNGEKQNNNDSKQFQANASSYYPKVKKPAPPQKLERELLQLSLQRKQAALERELRLQKSLSEECEDLGVDEPSTSDLFPEADLLFDSNHSPSFDQCSQDLIKKAHDKEESAKASMTLFSDEEDDDNSDSLRTDFLFEPVEYQTTEAELEYDRQQQLTNGQSPESGSSCEDNTLLQNCASMSDVTLNSPISCEYESSAMHKYKFKYSNRKKGERAKQNVQETWTAEVSSSEDTTGSTELVKASGHQSHAANCDEELSDSSYKIVHVAISKGDLLKDDESCEELHCDEVECLSGRGARRSVKKQCSCCNGQDGAARKRPASRPQTPAMHKKALINKKR